MGPALPPLRRIDLDGPVAFREWPGPAETTFVLVHGLGGMHLNWVQVAPSLSGLGRVLALDLPGFGASPLEGGRTGRLSDQRRIVSRFAAELGSGRIVLSGNSMGGAISILAAAMDPDAVDGLILTGAALPRVGMWWRYPTMAAAIAVYDAPGVGGFAVTTRVRRIEAERLVRLGFRITTSDPDAIPSDIVRLHVDAVRTHQREPDAVRAFGDAARSMLQLGRRPDLSTRALDSVRCPVLLLHGRRDRLVPVAYAEEVLRRYPAWRGRIFPDLGHVPQLEAPGRWLSEVADWFDRVT
jgi:pimeloyl-ACP methyl ester carboxylesterase